VTAPLYIHALGHFHPENVIDNDFLESLDIGTSDEWILERVGIRERRTVLPLDYVKETRNADIRAGQEAALYSTSDLGMRAAAMALDRAGLRASDIGMVVAGSSCPSANVPGEASRVAAALGIDAPALDIACACATFGAQLHVLASMRGLAPYVLVVDAESMTRTVSYADRANCVLFGDGASAAIVSTLVPARARVVSTTFGSSPAGWSLVQMPRFGYIAQDGGPVQRFAIKTTLECVDAMMPRARARLRETGGTLRFVGHQANMLVLENVARRADIAAHEHWHNVGDRGNTASAGAPSVLSQHWDELATGDIVLVAVVGAGLAWASACIEVD
jgi:3-oxoacyl-[acyl-carrier-protein] synthase-3